MPLTALVPAFTAGHWLNEIRFCRKWAAKLGSEEKQALFSGNWIPAWRRIWPVEFVGVRTNRVMDGAMTVTRTVWGFIEQRDHA